MQENLLSTMEEIREYFSKYHDKLEPLSTDEVIRRALSGTSQAFNKGKSTISFNENEIRTDLELNELDKARTFNNNNYQIHAHRPIHSHRRIIGKFLILGKKLIRKLLGWYINPIIEDQNKINASMTQCINEIQNKFIIMENNFRLIKNVIENQSNQTEKIETRIKYAEESVSSLNDDINEITNKIKLYEDLSLNINALKEELESDISHLTYRILNNDKEKNEVSNKFEIKEISCTSDKSPSISAPKLDYFLFENKFRGSEKSIKEAQKVYLKYFDKKDNVIDLGCGRGEFLELMLENNIKAKGVEPYEDYAKYCIHKGFDVTNTDAITFLNSLPDNSLGGIFMGQVLEHLSEDYLLKLIELAYKKLAKGCYFVAETPNPMMLSTFSNSFYLDLSHIKPVHPKTISFLAEYFGFENTEIIYREDSKINYNLPLLVADEHVHNSAEFNDGVNLLNQLLFGYQDYAIVARK